MLVIGAGPVGLAFAKALGGHGIPYAQVDADDDVGGNWYHGVYDTAHIISSKRTTEFADFPMPASYPDFPSAQQMLEYLRSYADEFGLRDRIAFNTKVIWAAPREDELWNVTFASGDTRTYKGVIVANGHHWDCKYPEYPGAFTGEWIHSKHYKSPEQLRGKRVLVIGAGNSACDLAAEAARVASSCHWSMRRGHWFMPKTIFGVPTVELLRPWMPLWLQRAMLRLLLRIVVGRYEDYGLQRPDHRIFETHPTINTEVLHYFKHGAIAVHPAVAQLEGDMIEFVDGARERFDLVVCATGFHVSFPFLPEGLVPVKDAAPQLYAGGTHPDYKHLYIVGMLQLRYGFGPLLTPYADLMCRLIESQEQMAPPIGRVVRALGGKAPSSHLVCPFRARRSIQWGRRGIALLPFFARLARLQGGRGAPHTVASEATFSNDRPVF